MPYSSLALSLQRWGAPSPVKRGWRCGAVLCAVRRSGAARLRPRRGGPRPPLPRPLRASASPTKRVRPRLPRRGAPRPGQLPAFFPLGPVKPRSPDPDCSPPPGRRSSLPRCRSSEGSAPRPGKCRPLPAEPSRGERGSERRTSIFIGLAFFSLLTTLLLNDIYLTAFDSS